MNFLAHAYLSFGHRQILVGNMIADFVKGAQKASYDLDVRQGITLHRAIDSFTDDHWATAKAKEIFRPHYRLYSGPIMDILYDHYLATDESEFRDKSLLLFSTQVYASLEESFVILPLRFAQMLPYMIRDNWLYTYRTKEGIHRSLQRMVRRASYLSDSETAYHLLLRHDEELKHYYQAFFPDVKDFAQKKLQELL